MRTWRSLFLVLASVAGGAVLGLLLSCLNAGFAFADTRYHLKWTALGLMAGLALGAVGFLIAWRSFGKRGGAVTGLLVGSAVAPAAFVLVGLMGETAALPGPGVLGTAAFLGGLFFMRVGLSLGKTMANEPDAGG